MQMSHRVLIQVTFVKSALSARLLWVIVEELGPESSGYGHFLDQFLFN